MIYELRVYHMYDGKLPAICARFADHTLALFRTHGIAVSDFWIDAEGNNTIFYICAFDSPAAREAAWASFRADPQWEKVKGDSEKDGPIVERVDSYVMKQAPFFTKG